MEVKQVVAAMGRSLGCRRSRWSAPTCRFLALHKLLQSASACGTVGPAHSSAFHPERLSALQ